MDLEMEEQPMDSGRRHGQISVAFIVERILAVLAPGSGLVGILLTELQPKPLDHVL